MLFEAYKKSVLTQQINPFMVEVRSPKEWFSRQLLTEQRDGVEWYRYVNESAGKQDDPVVSFGR